MCLCGVPLFEFLVLVVVSDQPVVDCAAAALGTPDDQPATGGTLGNLTHHLIEKNHSQL